MKPKRPRRSKSQCVSRNDKSNQFRLVKTTPERLRGKLHPLNLQEEKENFMTHGITPQLKCKDTLEKSLNKKRGQVRFDLFSEAKAILDLVKEKYGDEGDYYEAAYGKRIGHKYATTLLEQYFKENNVSGELKVYWSPDLNACASMMWRGPNLRYNKPEARRYSLVLKSKDNPLLREQGILCLADHEIGTHFFRMLNDGIQPWFSKRTKFGLRPLKCRELASTEEGLACLNTVIHAKSKLLFSASLIYYTACMSVTMSFKELYDHLETYVLDPEIRWKHVMRVKRGQVDPGAPGGIGHGQVYLEGAVEVLRAVDHTDIVTLYSGAVCVDQVNRIKRIARTDCIRTPKFIRDMEQYKKTLREIGYANRILQRPQKSKNKAAPSVVSATGLKSSSTVSLPPDPLTDEETQDSEGYCWPGEDSEDGKDSEGIDECSSLQSGSVCKELSSASVLESQSSKVATYGDNRRLLNRPKSAALSLQCRALPTE